VVHKRLAINRTFWVHVFTCIHWVLAGGSVDSELVTSRTQSASSKQSNVFDTLGSRRLSNVFDTLGFCRLSNVFYAMCFMHWVFAGYRVYFMHWVVAGFRMHNPANRNAVI
jgi:hypothetical protein